MSPWRRVAIALLALGIVLVAGTIGYLILGFSPLDAVYQTVTTVSTVGFREVEPLDTAGKIFTIFVILFGVGTALYAFGALIELLVEGRMQELLGRKRMERNIAAMRDHVIICGWGRVGRSIAEELDEVHQRLVVIDVNALRVEDCPYPSMQGDATEDATLQRAGIAHARGLIAAVADDAANLFVTLSARALRPDLFIVSRVRSEVNEQKLRRAGADRVVNPQRIGGARMAAFVVQPNVAEFVDVVMHDHQLEFRLEEVEVPGGSPICGSTLRAAALRDRTGALVLAVRGSDGEFRTNPTAETVVEAGDILISIGTEQQLEALTQLVGDCAAAHGTTEP